MNKKNADESSDSEEEINLDSYGSTGSRLTLVLDNDKEYENRKGGVNSFFQKIFRKNRK